MRKIWMVLGMLITFFAAAGQTTTKDSLKTLLQKEQNDTLRVLRLAELSYSYIESAPDTMLLLASEALDLSRKADFKRGEALSLTRIGGAYLGLGNYSQALEAYLKSLKIDEEINNPEGLQGNFVNIGVLYRDQDDYETALQYLYKAKALAQTLNNNTRLLHALTNIGFTYLKLKQYDSAILYAQQAYTIASRINYLWIIGSSFSDLGTIYFETGKNTLALEYYRLSFPYFKKMERNEELAFAYLGIAKVFEKNEQKDSALFYAKASLFLSNKTGFTMIMRDAAWFLSNFYRKINADSAFYFQDISKAASDTIFSRKKRHEFQSLTFDEKLRQQEILAAQVKAAEQRKYNLQYAAIALGVVSLLIGFFVFSH